MPWPEASDEELRALFGRRAGYYIGQWRGTATRSSNWAAFCFAALWLPYRRLYFVGLMFYLAMGALTVLEIVAFALLPIGRYERYVDRASALAFALVAGIWGNHWYLTKANRILVAVRALNLPPEQHVKELALRGGVRVWHAVGFCLLLLLFMLALGVAIGVVQAFIEALAGG